MDCHANSKTTGPLQVSVHLSAHIKRAIRPNPPEVSPDNRIDPTVTLPSTTGFHCEFCLGIGHATFVSCSTVRFSLGCNRNAERIGVDFGVVNHNPSPRAKYSGIHPLRDA